MDADKKCGKGDEDARGITRRDFSRVITLVAATAAVPTTSLAQPGEKTFKAVPGNGIQLTTLSPIAEAQVQMVFARYGDRLSEEQKADVKRLIAAAQKTSDELHAFHLDNSDEPAMIYNARLIEG
ncbi:MAG TPA: hypothetical protein VI756_12695 [Blastocatellia bacterium]